MSRRLPRLFHHETLRGHTFTLALEVPHGYAISTIQRLAVTGVDHRVARDSPQEYAARSTTNRLSVNNYLYILFEAVVSHTIDRNGQQT